MAKIIYFPSQNISTDLIPSPLETILFDKIEESNIFLNVSLGLSSSNLVISLIDTKIDNLDLEYSINNIDWFSTNVFEIDVEGDYTAYIRDKFGCSKQKDFTIDEIKSREDFINIPKANAIPFVSIETVDEINVFENDENLFDCDYLNCFSYSEDILFQNKDIPSLQIKSNYQVLKVYLRSEQGLNKELRMVKKSNYLNRFGKLDCLAYSHYSGRLAIYFDSGNIYNESDVVTGTHELNGNLPEFAIIGNLVSVNGLGTFNVSSILIDNEINKKIIIFEEEYLGEEVVTSASCIYDFLNFEVYEHYFDFSELQEGYYDVHIKATSESGFVKEFLSENLYIKEKHEKTICAHYYNKDNKDLFYKFGLINQLRVRYSDIERYSKDDSELNVNDDLAQLIKSHLNFGYIFKFEDLTTKQIDILKIMFSSENVFVNGIGYIKDGSPSYEKQENTNIYNLESTMLKTNEKLDLGDRKSTPDSLEADYFIPEILPAI
jgi:hypothetical protein